MDTSVAGSYEDLGGPTPKTIRRRFCKVKTPGGTLKQVKDVVNKGAKAAVPVKEEDEVEAEQLDTEEVIEEEEVAAEEVVAEEETETVAEYDIEEDVNALLGGEELSEDFKSKAKTIFEAAINTKVAQVKEALEAQYQEQRRSLKEVNRRTQGKS